MNYPGSSENLQIPSVLYECVKNYPGLVLVKDQALKIIYVNSAFCKKTSLQNHHILNKYEEDLFADFSDEIKEEEQQTVNDNLSFCKTREISINSKKQFWLQSKYCYSDNGVNFLIILTGCTDQKKDQSRKHQENETYLRAIVDYSDSGMVILYPDCRLKSFLGSDRVIESPDIIFKTLIVEIINTNQIGEVQENVSKVIETKKQLTVNRVISYKEQEYYFKDRYYPIENVDGKVVEVGLIRQDISKSTEVQEAYQTVVSNSSIGLIIIQDGKIVFLNRRFTEISGYSYDELLNKSIAHIYREMIPFNSEEAFFRVYEEILHTTSAKSYEFSIIAKNSSLLVLEFIANKITYNGKTSILASILDVTFRKKAERHLEMYKHIINSSSDQIMFLDKMLEVRLVNDEFLEAFEEEYDNIVGINILNFFENKLKKEIIEQSLSLCYKNKKPYTIQRWMHYPKDDRYMEISFFPYKRKNLKSEEIEGAVINLTDITESVITDLRMIDVAENERRKLAMELHDGLTHDLLGISIQAKLLKQKMKKCGESLLGHVQDINNELNRSISFARNLSKGISPVSAENKSLNNMLRELKLIIEKRYNIESKLTLNEDILFDDKKILENLYYIVDESVTNSVRHSGTEYVEIESKHDGEYLYLCIKDFGKGFLETERGNGMGLKFIKARCRSITAALDIDSTSAGTTVTCTLKV